MTEKTSNIGLGTAAIGRPQYINIRQEEIDELSLNDFRSKGTKVLDDAYNKGIRYFDTAPGYGLAEQLLIDWIAEKKYQDVEIATKWGYTYVANFDNKATVHEVKEHSLDKLNQQWEQSQKLLPYLSSYQIHSATLESKVLENKAVLHRLGNLKREYGLHIGLTTSGASQIEIVKRALEIEVDNQALFDVFQVTYNILDQSLLQIRELLAMSSKRIVVKEALANGRIFSNNKYPQYAKMYKELQHLAEKYNVGIDAIALRFCLDSIAPFMVLSGASNERHLTENLKVNEFEFEAEELSVLHQLAVLPEVYWQERKRLGWN